MVVVCLNSCALDVQGPGSLGQGMRETPPVNVCWSSACGVTRVAYEAVKGHLKLVYSHGARK